MGMSGTKGRYLICTFQTILSLIFKMKNILLIKCYTAIPLIYPLFIKIIIENVKLQLNNTNNSILHSITYNVIQLLINNLRITLFNSFHRIN